MKKKIFFNCLLIIFILGVAELISFFLVRNENINFGLKAGKVFPDYKHKTKYELISDFNPEITAKSFLSEKEDKGSVLWFGCSFAAGANLPDEKTPCAKISKLTGRSCINRAKNATGLQFVYYQADNYDLRKISPNTDFVVYTFIYDHIFRLYNIQINSLLPVFNLRYKISNGYPVEIKPLSRPLYSSFFVKKLLNFIAVKKSQLEFENFALFNRLIIGTQKRIRAAYPNAKFIIIRFPSTVEDDFIEKSVRKEVENLKSYGIEVFDANEFLKENGIDYKDIRYWTKDEIHPNEKLWDIILPELIKRYSM